MGSDRGVTEYFFEESRGPDERHPRHFFLDRDADIDPEVRRLQDLLQRKMPAIRSLLWRILRNDSELPEYMDRIYARLRGALRSESELDEVSIWRRAISIVHEDRKRARKRGLTSIDVKRLDVPDPEGERFVTALVRADQLQAFRDCLDDWTRQAFDLKYSSPVEKSAKELAKRFGIKRDAFYQRWKRGMDLAREEYRRRHGDPMQ